MISQTLLDYILGFLLGDITRGEGGAKLFPTELVVYTDCYDEVEAGSLVIVPSGFFALGVYGTEAAEPRLPLAEWQGIPLLFGEPRVERMHEGQTLVLHADLVASTYYLISRYEEMTHRSLRDEYGRFPAASSLPYRAGFIHRPVVDEYARALRDLLVSSGLLSARGLELKPMSSGFSRINLSLDVCRPFRYRSLRGVWRALVEDRVALSKVLAAWWGRGEADPYHTFAQVFALNKRLQESCSVWRVQTWLFLKVPTDHQQDAPTYRLNKPYMYEVLRLADGAGAKFGLLCSYQSSRNPHLIPEEMKRLRHELKKVYMRLYNWSDKHAEHVAHRSGRPQACLRELDLLSSRHSYLALGEPEDTREMLAAGIRHDHSMGYADALGFRLGTSRPVRFINPNTRGLSDLVCHPLTLRDSTLAQLFEGEEQAYDAARQLIEQVYRHGGELNMLWHNENFYSAEHPWLGRLYERLLQDLIDINANFALENKS